eukprot:7930045-Ditylum_brightwellii.AAC.1
MCLYRHQQDTTVPLPPHHVGALLLSNSGATLLAPKPGNSTINAGGLQHVQNRSRRNCPPASMMHREHHIGREGGGGDVGGAMV